MNCAYLQGSLDFLLHVFWVESREHLYFTLGKPREPTIKLTDSNIRLSRKDISGAHLKLPVSSGILPFAQGIPQLHPSLSKVRETKPN